MNDGVIMRRDEDGVGSVGPVEGESRAFTRVVIAALGVSPYSRLLPRPLDPPGAASRLPTAALKLDEPLAARMIYRSDMVGEHIDDGGPRFLPDAILGTMYAM